MSDNYKSLKEIEVIKYLFWLVFLFVCLCVCLFVCLFVCISYSQCNAVPTITRIWRQKWSISKNFNYRIFFSIYKFRFFNICWLIKAIIKKLLQTIFNASTNNVRKKCVRCLELTNHWKLKKMNDATKNDYFLAKNKQILEMEIFFGVKT